jgi:hypothetical protein
MAIWKIKDSCLKTMFYSMSLISCHSPSWVWSCEPGAPWSCRCAAARFVFIYFDLIFWWEKYVVFLNGFMSHCRVSRNLCVVFQLLRLLLQSKLSLELRTRSPMILPMCSRKVCHNLFYFIFWREKYVDLLNRFMSHCRVSRNLCVVFQSQCSKDPVRQKP